MDLVSKNFVRSGTWFRNFRVVGSHRRDSETKLVYLGVQGHRDPVLPGEAPTTPLGT